jgi:hypothetical protein
MQIDLEQIFDYHESTPEQTERYVALRSAAIAYAGMILAMCPDSAERTLAIRDVQRALMMANASIACNESGAE